MIGSPSFSMRKYDHRRTRELGGKAAMPKGVPVGSYSFLAVNNMDQFSFSGFSTSNMLTCIVDGADIYQTDYTGNRKLIGKTQAAYSELEVTTKQYYDKLVELGVIVPQKTPEEMMADMQKSMLDMSGIIAALSGEIKELKESGHKRCSCGGGADVPEHKSKRGGAKGGTGAQRDGEQP